MHSNRMRSVRFNDHLYMGVSAQGGVCPGGVHPTGSRGRHLHPIACWDTHLPIACWDTHTDPCEQNDRQVQKHLLASNFLTRLKDLILIPC